MGRPETRAADSIGNKPKTNNKAAKRRCFITGALIPRTTIVKYAGIWQENHKKSMNNRSAGIFTLGRVSKLNLFNNLLFYINNIFLTNHVSLFEFTLEKQVQTTNVANMQHWPKPAWTSLFTLCESADSGIHGKSPIYKNYNSPSISSSTSSV
jgi:hypothetical protein